MNTLETGDIILFQGTGWISRMIEYFGKSRYSHVGIVVKDPKFLNPELSDGIYLLDSCWYDLPDSEDHETKVGVQLHLLADIMKECASESVQVRRVKCKRDDVFYKKLDEIHKEIHNKPYDLNPYDWLCAKFNMICPYPPETRFQKTTSFWCSALVSYIFCKLGLLEPSVNWSLMAPKELSSESHLRFLCEVEKETSLNPE